MFMATSGIVSAPLKEGESTTRATLSFMGNQAGALIGLAIWLVIIAVVLFVSFFVIRGAILSALAEDRRRVAAKAERREATASE